MGDCSASAAAAQEVRPNCFNDRSEAAMPDTVARFTISIPPELLATFDEVCAAKGYVTRSEAVRDAIRDYLVAHRWEGTAGPEEVVGTVTVVYNASDPRPSDEVGPPRRAKVVSSMTVPLDGGAALEVLVVRGRAPDIASFADELISRNGVQHGRLVCTAAGLP